jgi:hypothetical protein
MTPARLRLLLPTIAIATGAAFAAGGTVYKWKDAKGGLHFSDTPPPAGATLISGPRPPPSQAASSEALPALQRDAAELARETPASDPAAHAEAERKAAGLLAQECEQLRLTRAALEKRRTGESTEILTDDERGALPASIAEVDGKIQSLCP